MTAVMQPSDGAAADCAGQGRCAPPRGVVSTNGPGAILNLVLPLRWILRVGCTALLGATLMLPELAESLVPRAPGGSGCRCANHACCALGSTSACPLSRGGRGCARARAPREPGLRSACDCSPGGEAAALPRQEPALPPGRLPALETPILRAGPPPSFPLAFSSLRPTPDPPPPRAALRPA